MSVGYISAVKESRITLRLIVQALTLTVLVNIFPTFSSATEVSGYFYKRPSFVHLGVGQNSACAVSDVGEVWCWGSNSKFQVSSRKSTFESTPFKLNGVSNALQVAVGREHACALLQSKRVVCWGSNEFGQLGTGFESSVLMESAIAEYVNGVINVSTIFTGDDHSCAITEQKELFCWGFNSFGQVGQLYKDESRQINGRLVIPQAERVVIEEVLDVGLGAAHSCAVTTTGYVYCWGSNIHGQLGQGWSIEKTFKPLLVGSLVDQKRIDSSRNSICALSISKSLRCWGAGESGQLGSLDTGDLSLPLGSNSTLAKQPVEKFSVGDRSTCAKLDKTGVYCWGSNSFGQVGFLNVSSNTLTPFSVRQFDADLLTQIETGADFSCVLHGSNISCWGRNNLGQLGRMTTSTFATYSTINNSRWDLGSNSISYSTSGGIVSVKWTQIGSSQSYARVESENGKLLCQTYLALTCDYRAERVGNQKNILSLQVLDVNGVNHSARAEFFVNVDNLSSAAETKIKIESENEIKKLQDKFYQDTQNRLLNQLKSLLLSAQEKLESAERKAWNSQDKLEEMTDSYSASRDNSSLISVNFSDAVAEYTKLLKLQSKLLKELAKLVNPLKSR